MVRAVSIKPVVFTGFGSLAAYNSRRGDKEDAFTWFNKVNFPFVWHGEVAVTALVDSPFKAMALVTQGFTGNVVAVVNRDWRACWRNQRVIRNARQVVAIETLALLEGTPFEILGEIFG